MISGQIKQSQRSIRIAFSLALALLVGSGLAVVGSMHQMAQERQKIVASEHIIATLDAVFEQARFAEGGRRGYLLTRQASYLETARSGMQNARSALQTARRLLPDPAATDPIATLLSDQFDLVEQSIRRFDQNPADRRAQVLATNQGRQYLEQLHQRLQQLANQDRQVLQQSLAAQDASNWWLSHLAAGGLAASLLLLLSLYWLWQHQIKLAQALALASLQQAEQSLNTRIVAILDRISDAFVTLDRDWRYTYVNQQAGHILFRAPADLLGQPVGPEFPAALSYARAQKMLGVSDRSHHVSSDESAAFTQVEDYYPCLSRWLENRFYASADGVSVFFQDITARKEAEIALQDLRQDLERRVLQRTIELQRSEARVRHYFDLTLIGMALVTPTLEWIEVNDRLCEIIGYARSEMLGRPCANIVEPADLPACKALVARVLSGEVDDYRLEKRFIHREGHWVEVNVSAKCLRRSDGSVDYFVAMIEDISERKRADRQLHQLNQELARSNQELDQFAMVASHDLQEPLRTIISHTQLLEADLSQYPLDGYARESLHFIIDGGQRMRQMIQDLLLYARAGQGEATASPMAGEAVLAEVMQDLQLAIRQSQAAITHAALPPEFPYPQPLQQVLQNLLANAIKFRSAAPLQIHISVSPTADQFWQFSVQDNGLGIDPRALDRIFAVFQRAHSRREFPGTGIGLAICKKIVERQGGKIWAESAPGCGTVVHFQWPQSGSQGGPQDRSGLALAPSALTRRR
jgi:PAS domain S-box-containing protein